MATEIGKGKYGKSVDIYAAGVILYEMLTGEVPFQGESAQEILVRHLADLPDLSRVPEPFVPVLRKGLAKDPEERYASLGEFARAVEATAAAPPAAISAPPARQAEKPAAPAPPQPPPAPVARLRAAVAE